MSAELTKRLSPEYLAVNGWQASTDLPKEFTWLGTNIPASFDSSDKSQWIGFKTGGQFSPMSGQIPTFALSFLYDLKTNYPVISISGVERGKRSTFAEYYPEDKDKKRVDPLNRLKKDATLDFESEDLDTTYPAKRTIPTNLVLGNLSGNPFLTQDDLITFYDPELISDKLKAYYRSLNDRDVNSTPVFDAHTKPLDPTKVNSRYFLLPDVSLELPSTSGAENPGGMFPNFRMVINPNYIEVELQLAEIKPEIQERLKKAPKRYSKRVESLDKTIATMAAKLDRLKRIRTQTTPEAIAVYIQTQRALATRLNSLPNLFPEGHQYWELDLTSIFPD